MAERITDFKQLDAWKVARGLVREVYVSTRSLPEDERFGLTSQMRRTAVSITSNIAEGYGRGSRQDYIRFLRIARGAATELETQVLLCQDLEFPIDVESVLENLKRCYQLLNGLLRSLE
jgi:four helix bundle protein